MRDDSCDRCDKCSWEGHHQKAKEYDVTGPEAITYTQLAEIFSSLSHTPVHYATISDEETEKALLGRYSP